MRKWTDYTNTNPPANDATAREKTRHASFAMQRALNDVAHMVFGMTGAVAAEKDHLRNHVILDPERHTVREFARRLEEINKYLPYFPRDDFALPAPTELPLDELTDILDRAKPWDWTVTQLKTLNGTNVTTLTWHERIKYYEQLEIVDHVDSDDDDDPDDRPRSAKSNRRGKRGDRVKNKRRRDRGSDSDRPKKKAKPSNDNKRTEACKHCGKMHFTADSECWTLNKNKDKKPKRDFKPKPNNERTYYTDEQVSRLIAALPTMTEKPVKKRKVSADSDDDNKSNTSSVTNSEYTEQLYVARPLDNRSPNKKAKSIHLTTEVIVEIEDRNGDKVPIKCLLDTGTSATLILRKFVARGKAKGYKGHATNWNTMGGTFTTKRKALLEFKLPEFSTNKRVEWVCHVDDTTDSKSAQYDMIIGIDLMTDIGLDICFSAKKIRWEGDEFPMKH